MTQINFSKEGNVYVAYAELQSPTPLHVTKGGGSFLIGIKYTDSPDVDYAPCPHPYEKNTKISAILAGDENSFPCYLRFQSDSPVVAYLDR